MKFTVLGSGTGVPSPRRGAASYVLQAGSDVVLFDCGMGTMARLLSVGLDPVQVTHLFLSHHHPDHCADTVALIFAWALAEERRSPEPLCIYGPTGTVEFLQRLYAAFPGLEPRTPFVVADEGMQLVVRRPDWHLQSGPVLHADIPAVGYRIDSDGGSLVYTGDTSECDEVVRLAEGADVLVSECSYPDDRVSTAHLNPFACGRVATRAKVGRVVLSHLYPPCDQADLLGACATTYAGPVSVAQDVCPV